MSIVARSFFYIQQVEQLARRDLDDSLHAEGLTAGQYMTLSLVVHHEPVSSADLSRLASITAQSMGEFIKVLEAKGLVTRRTDASNRRVALVSSTPAGRQVLVRCDAKVDQAERAFFACLSGEDYAHLRLLLNRVRSMRSQRTTA